LFRWHYTCIDIAAYAAEAMNNEGSNYMMEEFELYGEIGFDFWIDELYIGARPTTENLDG